MKKFTREELRKHNGKDAPAYVAYGGKVYDVSGSYLWETGLHQEEHEAGTDLTNSLNHDAPHDADLLENFPMVGELED